MLLPILYFYEIIQKLIKCTTDEDEITFIGRYEAVFTLAAEVKCLLRSSS
jgi:hypothetical protein